MSGTESLPAARRSQAKPMWTLVERFLEHYPDDWRLVFKRGDKLVEIVVDEETWRAFDD